MIEKFRKNPNLRHFLLYSLTYIFIGCFIAAPGPVIPFLSNKHNIPETQFSFFFTYRSIGFIAGALVTQFIISRFRIHTILKTSTIGLGIPCILFPFTESVGVQGICILISSMFCVAIGILLTTSIIEWHKGNNE